MKKILCCSLASFIFCLPVIARDPDSKEEADKAHKSSSIHQLMELMGTKKLMIDSMTPMFEQLTNGEMGQSLTNEGRKKLSQSFQDYTERFVNDPKLMEGLKKVYTKYFTEQEIKEMIAWYQTPLGQKTLKTMPQIMQESMQIGMEIGEKHAVVFGKEVEEIIEKHSKEAE